MEQVNNEGRRQRSGKPLVSVLTAEARSDKAHQAKCHFTINITLMISASDVIRRNCVKKETREGATVTASLELPVASRCCHRSAACGRRQA